MSKQPTRGRASRRGSPDPRGGGRRGRAGRGRRRRPDAGRRNHLDERVLERQRMIDRHRALGQLAEQGSVDVSPQPSSEDEAAARRRRGPRGGSSRPAANPTRASARRPAGRAQPGPEGAGRRSGGPGRHRGCRSPAAGGWRRHDLEGPPPPPAARVLFLSGRHGGRPVQPDGAAAPIRRPRLDQVLLVWAMRPRGPWRSPPRCPGEGRPCTTTR